MRFSLDTLNRALAYVKEATMSPLPEPAQIPVTVVSTGARRVCDDAVNLIKSFEGLHRVGSDGLVYAYHDAIGFPTIGYGRLLSRVAFEDLSKYKPITKDDAEVLLRQDLDKFARSVTNMLQVKVTDNQFGALVSLCFNIGAGNLKSSTLIRMLNRGDDLVDVADQFLRWNKAGGRILKGLTRRRVAERALFLS